MAELKRKRSNELPAGCLSLFGLPFLAAGCFLSWLYFSGFSTWWKSRNWVEVPCWVESTDLKTSRGDDSDTYQALATYRYEYQGRMWWGDKVSFETGSDNIGDFHQRVHRELSQKVVKPEQGAEIDPQTPPTFVCHVNPDNPSEAVLYRVLRWELQAFKAVFALTFPAVGAGLVVGGLIATGTTRKRRKLEQTYPDEPWKWRPEWTGTSIPNRAAAWAPAIHLYTLWSGLVIFTLLAATAASGAFQEEKSPWLLSIFVALWCVPAWLSVRTLRSSIATGKIQLEPARVPVVPGSRFEGFVVMSKPPPLFATAEITVNCEKRSTRQSGNESSTTKESVWSRSRSVPSDSISRDITGYRVPFNFDIPADAPETSGSITTGDGHDWHVTAAISGTAVRAKFPIPVFNDGSSPPALHAEPADEAVFAEPSVHDDISTELPTRLAKWRIQAEFAADGAPIALVCPPARNRQLLVFLVLFNLIWTGAAVLMISQSAPWIFRIVWTGSAGAIWISILWSLLHKRSVAFTSDSLGIRNQLGPISWGRQLAKNRIVGFRQDVNMTSNSTNFHRVRAEDVQGRLTTLVDGITESIAAEALIRRLEDWRTKR